MYVAAQRNEMCTIWLLGHQKMSVGLPATGLLAGSEMTKSNKAALLLSVYCSHSQSRILLGAISDASLHQQMRDELLCYPLGAS